MKKLTKLAVIVAALMMDFSFTGCSDDDEETSEVACYYANEKVDGLYFGLHFYSDNTVKVENIIEYSTSQEFLAKGTWSGNLSDNGEITITLTHTTYGATVELASPDVQTVSITEGKFNYNLKKVVSLFATYSVEDDECNAEFYKGY